jgi:hypothetical protein
MSLPSQELSKCSSAVTALLVQLLPVSVIEQAVEQGEVRWP